MTIRELSDKIIELAIQKYKSDNNKIILGSYIYDALTDYPKEKVSDAFRLLENRGIVDNRWASNEVYTCILSVDLIADL